MIPAPAATLNDLALKLLLDVAPAAGNDYAMADTALIAQLLMALSQEFEVAAEQRMQDVRELKTLFQKVDGSVAQADAREAYIARQPASLKLSVLVALHDAGMQLLIDLHAWAEQHDDALNRSIWKFLRRHTERHQFNLP